MQVPSFQPFNEKWGDTQHLSLWKAQVCEKHSSVSQWQGFGGWWVRRDTFLRWRAAPSLTSQDISPEKTFIWAQSSSYAILLTGTRICLSYELFQREAALHLCAPCGPDSSGPCDLFQVIYWTSERWLKNKPGGELPPTVNWTNSGTKQNFICKCYIIKTISCANPEPDLNMPAADASLTSLTKGVCCFLGSCLRWDSKPPLLNNIYQIDTSILWKH